jgi:hypothetical protein
MHRGVMNCIDAVTKIGRGSSLAAIYPEHPVMSGASV